MKVQVRDDDHTLKFTAAVELHDKPGTLSGPDGEDVECQWDQAVSDHGTLVRCPICGCRELFVRKAFPQKLGLSLTVVAGVAAFALFVTGRVWIAFGVLLGMALLDGVIYLFTPRCLVCYRCRSEFHDTPIDPSIEPWELATGEKYRHI